MDFPVCPSCHQSVLDDDAVDCPFCGASMKAKPGAKPAATTSPPVASTAKPSTAATGSTNPASSKSAMTKSTLAKPTLPGDDFPFESELTTGVTAIPAMPNPSKQRAWKVICPMCDTPGYLPATAAGKEVRCSNSKCVMPIFTAPSDKKKEEFRPPAPPKHSKLPWMAAICGVLLLTIGLGAFGYYVISNGRNSNSGNKLSQEDLELMKGFSGKKAVAGNKTAADKSAKEAIKADTPKSETTTEERIAAALQQMKKSCLETNKTQRRKPYCRQLSAEANAVTGNEAAAREHLAQLLKVGPEVSFYRIIPLLDLYWHELAKGDKKAAVQDLKLALTEVPKIPKYGRTRLEIIGRLAAALVMDEKTSDALKLCGDFHAADDEAQLAARLQLATDGKVAGLANHDSVLPWLYPQPVATTGSLITRGHLKEAQIWAEKQESDDAKAECLAFWAQEIAHQAASHESLFDSNGPIAVAVKSLPPALASRVWSRVGNGRFHAKDPAGVAVAIRLASEQLALIPVSEAPMMPSIEATHRYNLPPSAPLIQAVTAAAELANLQAFTPETKEAAEKSLDLAMAYADQIAPSLAIAKQRQDDADRLGTRLRDDLKKRLNKRTDDEARTAVNNYKRALTEILTAAHLRFDIETELLLRLRAAGVGLNEKVWHIINQRVAADDLNKKDNFFVTEIPCELVEELKGTPEAKEIASTWSQNVPNFKLTRPVAIEFYDQIRSNATTAVKTLLAARISAEQRETLILRAASQLAEENLPDNAFELIEQLPQDDMMAREVCYLLVAGIATKRGQVELVWKQVENVVQQTEKVSICRGLIAGLLANDSTAQAATGQVDPQPAHPVIISKNPSRNLSSKESSN